MVSWSACPDATECLMLMKQKQYFTIQKNTFKKAGALTGSSKVEADIYAASRL